MALLRDHMQTFRLFSNYVSQWQKEKKLFACKLCTVVVRVKVFSNQKTWFSTLKFFPKHVTDKCLKKTRNSILFALQLQFHKSDSPHRLRISLASNNLLWSYSMIIQNYFKTQVFTSLDWPVVIQISRISTSQQGTNLQVSNDALNPSPACLWWILLKQEKM